MRKNKKNLARILALTLSLVMALGLSVTAFAAGNEPDAANIKDGATEATDEYPGGMSSDKLSSGVTQFVDRDWLVVDAANSEVGDASAATLTVNGITKTVKNGDEYSEAPAVDGDFTVKAYRIIEPVYDEASGTFLRWKTVANAGVELVDEAGNVKNELFTRANIGKLGSTASDGMLGDGIPMTLSNGTATCDTAPGSYVVLVKNNGSTDESCTYGPMIISAFYCLKDDGSVGLKDPTLGLVANQAFAKKQQAPTVDKQISGGYTFSGNDVNVNGDGNYAIADDGDYIWFDILVKSLPEYHGDHPVFKVTDTISANLRADLNSVEIVAFFGEVGDGHTGDNPFTGTDASDMKLNFVDTTANKIKINKLSNVAAITQEGQKITFDFVNGSGNYTLNDYAGFDMIIRYRAEVASKDMAYGEGTTVELPNEADLEYSRNSAIENDIGKDEDDPPVYVYSTKAVAKKVGPDGKPLPGAKFELFVYDGDGNELPYYNDKADGEDGKYVVTSDAEGNIVMAGLGVGEYVLRELEAPAGYVKSDKAYKFTVTATDDKDGRISDDAAVIGGRIQPADYTPEGEANPGILTIANSRMTDLPTTGGAGTALLMGLGIVGALIGCAVIFGTRKKQED